MPARSVSSSATRKFASMSAVLALVLSGPVALAQSARESERAEKLFSEATVLAGKGAFADACPKFEESQRLDPALGTQFNLALCQEKIGRFASAWRNYRAVERLARRTGKTGRLEAARQKIAELQPRVAAFVFTVREPDVTLKVDGERVDAEETTFYAVEPGEHAIEATSPAKKAWATRVTVAARNDGGGDRIPVRVPTLATISGETRVVTVNTETTNKKRTIGFAVLGVGAVGVAGAAVTGIMLLNDKSTADQKCTPRCDADGASAVSEGKALLPVNVIAWAVAGAGLSIGSFLLFTSGSSSEPKSAARARLAPLVGTDRAGAALVGSF